MYHLVCITEGDEWKTAFQTRYGSFEWLVMQEGLANAPASHSFSMIHENYFHGYDRHQCQLIIYLDDILIYSNNLTEHKQHVWEVVLLQLRFVASYKL